MFPKHARLEQVDQRGKGCRRRGQGNGADETGAGAEFPDRQNDEENDRGHGPKRAVDEAAAAEGNVAHARLLGAGGIGVWPVAGGGVMRHR